MNFSRNLMNSSRKRRGYNVQASKKKHRPRPSHNLSVTKTEEEADEIASVTKTEEKKASVLTFRDLVNDARRERIAQLCDEYADPDNDAHWERVAQLCDEYGSDPKTKVEKAYVRTFYDAVGHKIRSSVILQDIWCSCDPKDDLPDPVNDAHWKRIAELCDEYAKEIENKGPVVPVA